MAGIYDIILFRCKYFMRMDNIKTRMETNKNTTKGASWQEA